MSETAETAGTPSLIGWRFAPLTLVVLVGGAAVCWKLVDSGAIYNTLTMGDRSAVQVVEVRGHQSSDSAPQKQDADAVDPVKPEPEKAEPRQEKPIAASIAPSSVAPMVTLTQGPRIGTHSNAMGIADISVLAVDDNAVHIVSSGRSEDSVTEPGSISSVEALLAAANNIVGIKADDSAAGASEAGQSTAIRVGSRPVETGSESSTPLKFDIVVVSPDEILRPTVGVANTVRKTNHESMVETWNSMPAELVDSIDSGTVARVRELVADGVDINVSDIQGLTPLMKAAWNSDSLMVRALLDLGADVHLASNNGRTALFTGVVSGNIEVVKLLLEAGAPANAATDSGKTPLMASAWSDYPEIALLLLRYGAEPNQLDDRGRGALFYALWDRNEYVAKLLAANGADLETTDYLGQSAADIARLRRIELGGIASRQSILN